MHPFKAYNPMIFSMSVTSTVSFRMFHRKKEYPLCSHPVSGWGTLSTSPV